MGRDFENFTRWRIQNYAKNKDTINAKRRKARAVKLNNPKERKKERKKRATYFKAHDKPYHAARIKRYRNKLKTGVITAYGGKCSCCGELHPDFLTVDHVNNDGKKHRASVTSVYRDLRNRGYPSGYTILCFNCNIARSLFGTCPHQR